VGQLGFEGARFWSGLVTPLIFGKIFSYGDQLSAKTRILGNRTSAAGISFLTENRKPKTENGF
jgi:hypothetical protein